MDLTWMNDDQYDSARRSYRALMDLREKVFEIVDGIDDAMRQHPLYCRMSYTISETKYAGLSREEYQQVKWLERLYAQIEKEAVEQDEQENEGWN